MNVQMQLTHAGNDGLAGFLVAAHAERRIFLRQSRQCDSHLFLVGLGLRLHRHRDDRLRETHPLKRDDLVLRAQRVAGGDVFQSNRSGDVARADFLDFFAIVRVHLQDRPMRSFLPLIGL